MRKIRINTPAGESLIITGGSAADLRACLPQAKLFIITDTTVMDLYGASFPSGTVLVIEPGEKSKTLRVVEDLCIKLLNSGADRSSFILGYGGGVVCDVAGLVASVYMRGVRHGFVSTTLLSQVDASIGGKTGVNLGLFKNIIGTFRQPEFVICDQSMLATLSDEEYISGTGELIKHAVIRNRLLFFDIANNCDRLLERDKDCLEDFIFRAVQVKAGIVRRDPFEKNSRRILNFGHTFGHPLETAGAIPHGIAVMKGMLITSDLSVWKGLLSPEEHTLLAVLLERVGVKPVFNLPLNILKMISADKKAEADHIHMALLNSIGKAVIRKVKLSEIEAFAKNKYEIIEK